MHSTERKLRVPPLHGVVDLDRVRRDIEKLSLRQALQLLDQDSDGDIVAHDGHVFKIYRIRDKVPVTVLASVVDCPWSIVTAVLIAQQYGASRGTLYVPIDNVYAILYGRTVRERYLTYLEEELNVPIEVELETEVQADGRYIRIVGKADALVPAQDRVVLLEVKTSSRIAPRHVLQVWAYVHMHVG